MPATVLSVRIHLDRPALDVAGLPRSEDGGWDVEADLTPEQAEGLCTASSATGSAGRWCPSGAWPRAARSPCSAMQSAPDEPLPSVPPDPPTLAASTRSTGPSPSVAAAPRAPVTDPAPVEPAHGRRGDGACRRDHQDDRAAPPGRRLHSAGTREGRRRRLAIPTDALTDPAARLPDRSLDPDQPHGPIASGKLWDAGERDELLAELGGAGAE